MSTDRVSGPGDVMINQGSVLVVIPVAGGDDTVAPSWRTMDAFERWLRELEAAYERARVEYEMVRPRLFPEREAS